ncbi:MAG: DUF1566 domain-containing protein [bacterium]|nr:DUF1566 domain-containing protein [bacterium]
MLGKEMHGRAMHGKAMHGKEMKRIVIITICLIWISISTGFLSSQNKTPESPGNRRVALVIGNASYKYYPLKKTTAYAEAITGTLKKSGFDVTTRMNLSFKKMKKALRRFGRQLKKGDTALFYFSGYGLQVNDTNYLLPVNATIAKKQQSPDSITGKYISMDFLLEKMKGNTNPQCIVLLDACRVNPFKRNFENIVAGLAEPALPEGVLIAYSTDPEATTTKEWDSLFTKHLTGAISGSRQEIDCLLGKVRENARVETNGAQAPWIWGRLKGEFYFNQPVYSHLTALELKSLKSKKSSPSFSSAAATRTRETVKEVLSRRQFYEHKWNPGGNYQPDYKIAKIKGDNVIIDPQAAIMWHQSGSPRSSGFPEAKKWLVSLNNKKYAGYSDWRIPTLEEAASLLRKEKRYTYSTDPLFSCHQDTIWTSDFHLYKKRTLRWYISFRRGAVVIAFRDYPHHIRPVRSLK